MNSFIRTGLLLIISGTCLISASCEKKETEDQPGNPVNISMETYQKEVIDSANSFAFDIFRPAVSGTKGESNVLISPFSITSALSMTLNGAAGETFEAMRKSLGFNKKSLEEINKTYQKLMEEMVSVDKRVLTEIANSVWVEKKLTVKEPFINDLKEYYKAEAKEVDVTDGSAVKTVNSWIASKTNDKITNMLNELDPNLAMLLINAVYFNGKWRYQFNESETDSKPFYITPSSPKNVPTMHQTTNLRNTSTETSTIVELPYGQGNYTMVVVLPDNGISTEDISAHLTPAIWNGWMDKLSSGESEVVLSIPRFKYEYKRSLKNDLINLGMGIAFTENADFSNISSQNLTISDVLHQSFIETSEEGTEAAAATAVIMVTSSGPGTSTKKIININRPFLYFIREVSTGTILFAGKVCDPSLN